MKDDTFGKLKASSVPGNSQLQERPGLELMAKSNCSNDNIENKDGKTTIAASEIWNHDAGAILQPNNTKN